MARRDLREWLLLIVISLLAIAVLFGVARAVLIVPLKLSLDPNEGWNAYHAASVLTGIRLYPAASSLMVNNYPPLSFYVVAALSRLTGDVIVVGRILSLLGVIGIGGGITLALRIARCSRRESVGGALFFVAAILLFSDYVGMDDPQLFAQAIQIGALVLLLWRPRSDAIAISAGLLFVLTLFFKHNLFILPLATTLWLASFDLRRAAILVLCGGAATLLGLLMFHYVYGVSLFSVLATPRVYSLPLLFQNLRDWLAWAALPVIALCILCLTQYRERFVRFCAVYGGLAVVLGAILLGGAGVDANAMFDADIALALVFGLCLSRYSESMMKTIAVLTAFIAPLINGAANAAGDEPVMETSFWIHPLQDETVLANRNIAFLSSHRGPAFCETLALCYWAGKTAEVDVFNAGQKFLRHAHSDAPLMQKIAAGYFHVIQFETLTPFPLTPAIHTALTRRYRVDHADDSGTYFVPR